jgi:2-polyprenyl-3-methyl-5-hydroxy-6-metoxy-1,4-benzoquinol methylase
MSTHHARSADRPAGNVCPWWLCATFDNRLRRLIQNPDRILAGLVQPGETALDVGCGMGYFSIPLARLVGPEGSVIGVDLQEQMLAGVRRRAERSGVADRIRLHQARMNGIGVEETVDFALAFWMLHEVPDQTAFLAEVRACLKPGGRLLVVEPRLHVGGAAFERSVAIARGVGLLPIARPAVALSRAVLFSR